MELAQVLTLLWRRKIWVALGVVVALAAGVASVQLLKQHVYAAAATQMIVDSPRSPLGNAGTSLEPFTARASVFADLMTSPPALQAISRASGIPADQIAATGPANVAQTSAGSGPATPARSVRSQAGAKFKLFLDQDPTLPTVDVYAQAPTTAQAIALADGAVAGFSNYLGALEDQKSISANQRVEIRKLGNAVGGMVDPGANNKFAAIIALGILLLWCAVILVVERVRGAGRGQKPQPATTALGADLRIEPEVPAGSRSGAVGTHFLRSARADGKDGRLGTQVSHRLAVSRDAPLAESTDRVAALAEPSPAPDEG